MLLLYQMTMRITRIVTLFLTVAWLWSCNRPGTSSELMQMEFDVDRNLLADEPVIDSLLGVSFLPPKFWIAKEIQSLHLPEDALSDNHPVAKYFFMHPTDSSSLLIAELPSLSNEQLTLMRVNFYEIFNSQGIWDDVQHAGFAFNQFEADQFLMHNGEMINFKLILTPQASASKENKLSLDFFLPRLHYEQNIKSVESTIGSFLLLNLN